MRHGSLQRSFALTCLLLLQLLTAHAFAQAQSTGLQEVVAVVPAYFPPEYDTDVDGAPIGFAVDTMRYIGAAAGLDVEFRVVDDWPAVHRALANGEADLSPLMGITAERSRAYLFTRPIETFGIVIFVRNTQSDIVGYENLVGRRVAVVETNVAEMILRSSPEIRTLVLPSLEVALLELLAGSVDALVSPQPVLQKLAHAIDLDDRIKVVGPPLREVKRAIAVPHGREDLLAMLNPVVDEFVGSPAYLTMMDRWFDRPASYWTTKRIVLAVIGAALVVLLLGAGFAYVSIRRLNVRLKGRVKELDHALSTQETMRAELQSSEARYRLLFETYFQGILVVRGMEVLLANDAAAHIVGYPSVQAVMEALKTRKVPFTAPEFREHTLQTFQDIEAGRVLQDTSERILIARDGTDKWVRMASRRIDWDGRPAVLCMILDLTPIRQAESKLRMSEERYRHLVQGSIQGMSIIRGDRFLFANQAYADLLGYPSTDDIVAFPTVDEAVAPEFREEIRQIRQDRLAGKQAPRRYRYKALRRDGSMFWVENQASKIQWEGEWAVLSTMIDIDQQMVAETELRHSEESYRSLFEASLQGISVTRGGVPQLVNDTYAHMVGYVDAETYLQINEGKVLPVTASDSRAMLLEILEALETGRISEKTWESNLVDRDGNLIFVRTSARRIDWDGQPAVLSTVLDLSAIRQTEEELRRSEEKYRTLVEGSIQAAIIVHRRGKLLFANAAAATIYGFPNVDAFMGFPSLDELYVAEDLDRVRDVRSRTALGKPTLIPEVRVLRKDGSIAWVMGTISQIIWDGEPAYQGILFDVTPAKQAQEALLRSEERYRTLVEGSLQAILVHQDGKPLFTNRAGAEIFGMATDELLALPSIDALYEPEDMPAILDCRARLKRGESCSPVEYRVNRPDGTTAWVMGSASHTEWEGALATQGVLVDITETKRAQKALQRQTAYFRAVVENSVDVITLVNQDGTILLESPSITTVLGYDGSDIVGRKLPEIIHTDDGDAVRAALEDGFSRYRGDEVLRIRMRHKDGSWRLMDVSGKSLSGSGNALLIVINARDITDQHRLEQQYRQAQKMEAVGQLAGGIAHDFKNILSVILSYCEILMDDTKLALDTREIVEQVASAGERADTLTRQLLAFSRQQDLRLTKLDLARVVLGLEKLLSRLVRENVVLEIDAPTDVHWVEADASQIEQVLLNLVVNAQDAMPAGGLLRIAVEAAPPPNDDAVRLVVSDTGTGMTPEVVERIFEPFYTTKEFGKGTGLGLSMVYGTVNQLGGSIHVDSKPGRGTTFIIEMKGGSPKVREEVPPLLKDETIVGQGTILLTEDEAAVRRVARRILERAGYLVIEAACAEEAIGICETYEGEVDLLLTDLILPDMNGIDLSNRLLTIRPSLQTILMSGYDGKTATRDGEAEIPFIMKPFRMRDLLNAVGNAINQVP